MYFFVPWSLLMTTNYKNEWISPWHLYLCMHNAESSHRTFPHTVYFSSLLAHFLKECLYFWLTRREEDFFPLPSHLSPPPSHWHSSLTRFSLSFSSPPPFSVCMWVDTCVLVQTQMWVRPKTGFLPWSLYTYFPKWDNDLAKLAA